MNVLTEREEIIRSRKVLFKEWNCTVKITRYKRLGKKGLWRIDLIDSDDNNVVGTATVFNLKFEEEKIEVYKDVNHIVLIRTTDENEGMFESLYSSGVITHAVDSFESDGRCYIVAGIID